MKNSKQGPAGFEDKKHRVSVSCVSSKLIAVLIKCTNTIVFIPVFFIFPFRTLQGCCELCLKLRENFHHSQEKKGQPSENLWLEQRGNNYPCAKPSVISQHNWKLISIFKQIHNGSTRKKLHDNAAVIESISAVATSIHIFGVCSFARIQLSDWSVHRKCALFLCYRLWSIFWLI